MKNIYIDFDGVILDTIKITYKMASQKQIKKTYESYLKFFRTLDWKIILNAASTINNSYGEIQKIIDSNRFNVSILTHVTTLEEAEEKIKIINRNLKDITIITVPKTISKTKVVKVENSILVDDYSYNLKEWEEAGGIGIKFDPKLENSKFPVINYLSQILEIF